MKRVKLTEADYRALLARRRRGLAKLLAMDAPDIIVARSMRLVTLTQRKLYGRGWDGNSWYRQTRLEVLIQLDRLPWRRRKLDEQWAEWERQEAREGEFRYTGPVSETEGELS